MTALELAARIGVHVTTARRWRRHGMPAHVTRWLELSDRGELGPLSPTWHGWQLRCGMLVDPDGSTYTPGEVRAGALHQALARELRRELEAATQALLSAQERRALRAALGAAYNALEAATAATLDLVDRLTGPERQRIWEGCAAQRSAALEDPPEKGAPAGELLLEERPGELETARGTGQDLVQPPIATGGGLRVGA